MSDVATPEMLDVVRNLLRTLGYQEPLLVSEYKFGHARGREASSTVSHHIDLAAFAQSPPSVRSACIGVTVSSDDSPERIAGFHSLGAPQILAINPDKQRVTRWRMPASGLPVYQDPTPFAQIDQLFALHKTDWSPDTILRAKGIAFSPMPPQLDFIDVGYLPALEEELRIRLNRDLNNILDVCKKTYIQRYSEEVFEAASGSLYRLLFRLIAAKYAIDRGKQPEWKELSASDVVREVEAFFSGSATLEPALDDVPTRDAAWQEVRGGLNLSNLSPEILAHVYENTLVTPSLRKTYGIHATPPAVAEYIVSHLPIGELSEDDRRIFEPFCGAAPFLIASLGQLRTVGTEKKSPEEQHNYFQQMLVGMEISEFSREIARCSLILADDTNRDSWQIFSGEAFTSPDFERYLQWAKVVLCNPPHETFAKAEQPKPTTAVYDNQAAEVLHRVLKHKPPIIGFVLPRTFTDGQAFLALREEIVNTYNDVSVVVLPDKAFEKASQEVVLLMAHNLGERGQRYYSANVSEDEWESFLRTGRPFDEYETSTLSRHENGTPILWYPPLQKLWNYLADYPKLDAYAEIHRGIQYNSPVEASVFDTPQPDTRPGVSTQSGYMEALVKHDIIFALGPAGTGKTYLAVAQAVSQLITGSVDRLILSRPAVEAGEKIGFLPGDMKEKVDPYLRPLYDALYDCLPAEQVERRIASGEIEIAPIAFMRGRTLADSFIILDEAQNTSAMQMKMFLTRFGQNSRMVVCGDPNQTDLPDATKSGLNDAVGKLEGIEGIGTVRFGIGDVVRHPVVGRIVEAYEGKG